MDLASDIEQHNVTYIMLRNISLGLLFMGVEFLLIFLFSYTHIGNLLVAIVLLMLSYLAVKRAELRRRWFYMGLFEAYGAKHLLPQKIKQSQEMMAQAWLSAEEE